MFKRSFLFLVMFVCSSVAHAAVTEKTHDEQLAWVANYLKQHMTCTVNGEKVSVVSDGQITSGNGLKEFVLSVGDKFHNPPDEHAVISYTLKSILPNAIDVEYESNFDHRSFGKDLITIDSGVVSLPCP